MSLLRVMTRPLRNLCLLCALVLFPAGAHASPLYLYTINFDPTPISAFTSVSYLTQTLQNGTVTNFTPGESTVLSLPGQGAVPYPGNGAGSISNAYASLAFNRNNSLTWLFEGDTAANITGAGTYPFSQTFLSTALDPATTYHPTGDVVVQELATPPTIFRYTETWNATGQTPGASFYYDSPVIIDGFLPLLGTDIHSVKLPAAGTYPYSQGSLFGVGNTLAEGLLCQQRGRLLLLYGANRSLLRWAGDVCLHVSGVWL